MNESRKSLKEALNEIRTTQDVLKIVSSAESLVKNLTPFSADQYFPESNMVSRTMSATPCSQPTQTHNMTAAAVLLIPVKFAPKSHFYWGKVLISYLQFYHPAIQLSMMMKLAEASMEVHEEEDTLQMFRRLLNKDENAFQLPCVYLSTCMKRKIDFEIKTIQNKRCNAMTLFYAGANYMLFKDYIKAREFFFHSLNYSENLGFESNIVDHFALTCFLTEFEERQCTDLLPEKLELSDLSKSLWNLDSEIDFSTFLKYSQEEIKNERIRRKIIRVAKVSAKIPLYRICAKIGILDKTDCIDIMKKHVSFKIEDGIVTFDISYISRKLTKETEAFQEFRKNNNY